MAHIEDRHYRKDRTRKSEYGKGLRWRVVWQEGDGKRRTKSFRNRDAAQAHLTGVGHKQLSGEYIPQANRRALVRDLLPEWELSLIRLKPSTRGEVRYAIQSTLLPRWGDWQVGAVRRQDVQQWVHEMHANGRAGRTVDTLYGRLRTFYAWCVAEGHVPVTPCQNVTLPRGVQREHVYLSPAQVRALLDHIDPHYRLLTETLVTTGLRFGELAELRVKDLDLDRRRARINRSITRGVIGTPKSHKGRTVPLTAGVAEKIAATIEGKDRDDLVFTGERGGQINVNNWRVRVFNPAVTAAGLPEDLRPHDLRHTAASLLVRSGASVKALQNMLGHADAKITLTTYSGLYSEELDDLGARMEELLGD